MMSYKRLNNIAGWGTFLISLIVYLMTLEPTASWWDCGEFIASSYKLEVGHPPGNALFILLGRFFTFFAGGNLQMVPVMVNVMSALMSAFTILFLFWTITALGKKIAGVKPEEMNPNHIWKIIGSGLVGALAFTFSDSFWFSAVEGEVYASSSFFTAIVFWCILKWEETADDPKSIRWIILIAYLVGLSINIHLLNLLTIPAIGLVFYFRKYKPTAKGVFVTLVISFVILLVVQYGIVGGLIKVASKFDLLFVNSFGMGFGSGIIIFTLLIAGISYFGIRYTIRKGAIIWNTFWLSFIFILIGYSSFVVVIIRAQANTPINENDPSNVFSFLSYVNREQYGDRPLFYGQYYDADIKDSKNGDPIYAVGKDKYEQVSYKPEYKYDSERCTVFPRMYSTESHHIAAYKSWGGIKGESKPNFSNNLKYFFTYQMNHMYFRYFMWNFAGRQNDIQGHGSVTEGNWITGIPFLDNMRLGSQSSLSDSQMNNKGRNTFFMLPFILGLIGMFFHFSRHRRDAWSVMLFFFMTGAAIVLYLNQYPYQPRERDYAYAGSFYVFAVWIGLGVMSLAEFLQKKRESLKITLAVTAACIVLVPGIMAAQGWDDHDRSNKYTARDFAANYLMSCKPNAILITNGDNDTFPLWYCQEVEGIRTDVRVINMELASGDWYIKQFKYKLYDSPPIDLTLSMDDYRTGTNDFVPLYVDEGTDPVWELKDVMKFLASKDPDKKVMMDDGKARGYIPCKSFKITVDSATVVKNGIVSKDAAGRIQKVLEWKTGKQYIYKNDLVIMDLIATNFGKRPIYFVAPSSISHIVNVEPYFQLEGFASELVPVKLDTLRKIDNVNTEVMYDNIMNKCKWGNVNDPSNYLDPETRRMCYTIRIAFGRLASALVMEGKKDKAIKVCDRCLEVTPDIAVPYDLYVLPVAEAYYASGATDKANAVIKRLVDISENELNYYFSLGNKAFSDIQEDAQRCMAIIQRCMELTERYKQTDLNKNFTGRFNRLAQMYQAS